jgi:hypothetical protein
LIKGEVEERQRQGGQLYAWIAVCVSQNHSHRIGKDRASLLEIADAPGAELSVISVRSHSRAD